MDFGVYPTHHQNEDGVYHPQIHIGVRSKAPNEGRGLYFVSPKTFATLEEAEAEATAICSRISSMVVEALVGEEGLTKKDYSAK